MCVSHGALTRIPLLAIFGLLAYEEWRGVDEILPQPAAYGKLLSVDNKGEKSTKITNSLDLTELTCQRLGGVLLYMVEQSPQDLFAGRIRVHRNLVLRKPPV